MIRKLIAVLFVSAMAVISPLSAENLDKNVPELSHEISSAKMLDGELYIRSFRGKPNFILFDKEISAKTGDLIPAKGLSFKAKKSENAVLVFSNRTAVFAKSGANFEIEKFEQKRPFRSVLNDDREASQSTLRFRINSGEFYFAGLEARESSSTVLNTEFGYFDIRAESYRVMCIEGRMEISVMEGQVTFHPSDNGKTIFMKSGETAMIEKLPDGTIRDMVEQIAITVQERFVDEFAIARFALSTSNFSFERSGKMRVEKLLPPNFFIGRARYDYRF